MTDKPKRYIKIEKDGKTLIVDTYLKTAIEAEYADVWLNCENKSRIEAEDTAKEIRRELAKLRGASFKTTRTIVDLRQRRRRAASDMLLAGGSDPQ